MAVQRGEALVYELANDAYRSFLGGRELVGKPLAEVLPEPASLRGILTRVYQTGEPYAGKEFPFLVDRKGDGFTERAWFNFICQPTRDPLGAVDGVVTFAVEVTEHVVARQKIEALANDLREAVRARDEFISIASHELRTPLTPIVLQVQLLQRHAEQGPLDQNEVRERLELIQRNVGRLNDLVDTLLDVSRVTAHKLELTLAEVDLVALVVEVVARLREPLACSRSTVTIAAPSPVIGTWDRLRIDQVVTNLVSNAIKYGGGQPITVHVSSAGGVVRLAVEDRGIGIADADRARIFERFERAVSVRHYGGFGLGLWMVRQLVEALGGTIRLDSEIGRGSTFTVELPHHS
jgi:signal transduction histidine kinase